MLTADVSFEIFPESALSGSIVDRFAAVATRYAGRIAVSDIERTMTYAELARLVGNAATNLRRELGDREGAVGILMPHEARFPAAILSVLAAGRAHVPLDISHPIERNRIIAEAAGAAAVLSTGDSASHAGAFFPEHTPVLDFDRLAATSGAPDRRPPLRPEAIAQIVYTSGSIGAPKGVYNNHRNCLHDILVLTNAILLAPEDRIALLYSPSVIGGLRLTLGALLNGAALHILPPRELQAAGLVREIRERGITIYGSVPALFRQLAETVTDNERLDSIRLVRLGGDRVDWSDVDLLKKSCPRAALTVSLGSTECSSHYAEWVVDHGLEPRGIRLPVGRPMPDVAVAILDEDSAPVPDGEVGEFAVSGRYLALGYWRMPEATEAAFLAVPGQPGVRTFRTGDMGCRRADGLLEFAGRKDQQFKLRGHRIEPAEIETTLRSCAGVDDAAVVVRRDESGRPRSFVAYVEGGKDRPPLRSGAVLDTVARSLPRYMVPAALFVMDSLPRLPSLKLDRLRLAEIDATRSNKSADGRDDPLVDEIASLFERLLGMTGARGDDGFISLGGDSLKAVAATMELENRYGITVPAELLGEMATIADVARWIGAAKR
jgi:amino acid adenylation domain-containing protein